MPTSAVATELADAPEAVALAADSARRAACAGVLAAGLLPPLQDLISPYVAMAILAVPLFLMLRSWSRTGYSPLPVA